MNVGDADQMSTATGNAGEGPAAPELSVVVVTWNCRDMALHCLRTVLPMLANISHEVFVVDNASGDGTAEAVTAAFPALTVIRNPINAGFAAANNLALARATGRFWLLLNPDAFPCEPTAIKQLLTCVWNDPRVGAAGPRLVRQNGSHQVGDAGFAPTLAAMAVHAFSLMRVSPRQRGLFLAGALPSNQCDVDWLSGACLLVRAQAARQVGLLDDSFFIYGEDIEWGCRMRDGGWRLVYLSSVEVLHIGGGTQPKTGPVATRWLDGLTQVYVHRNGRALTLFRIVAFVGFGLRALVYSAASLVPGRHGLRGRARHMAAYARHILLAPLGASQDRNG